MPKTNLFGEQLPSLDSDDTRGTASSCALYNQTKSMTSLPLRAPSPLAEPYNFPQTVEHTYPRALKSLSKIVNEGLCHRCGTCVGICPTRVLSLDADEYPTVSNLKVCTDCDLCVKVCPGVEFNAQDIAKELFGHVPDITDMHGHFEKAYLVHASDKQIRSNISTSGGLVTALLLSMLRRGEIDGAIVVASDEKELWKGRPIFATTEAEIISAAKSKYAISPTNSLLGKIRERDGRFALVGLPCQIHGYLKAARLDRKIRSRITLTIGLFCHAAVEHEPMRYIWESIGPDRQRAVRFISRIGKHPGTPHIQLDDGTLKPVYFPKAKRYRPNSMEMLNILYRLYTPPRCLTCYDSTAEFADIAVGDPWMPKPAPEIDFKDGYSFALSRTPQGTLALEEASLSGDLTLIEIKGETARRSNVMMGHEKRWRAFRIIETQRNSGKPIPDYGFDTPRASGKHFILTEMNMLSHIFCFCSRGFYFGSKGRIYILRFFMSTFGYRLLWLNHQRRSFRMWRRELIEATKRKLLGKKALKDR